MQSEMLMVGNISLMSLEVNLGAVSPVLPPNWYASAAGKLGKSLVSLATAETSLNSYILFILTPKHSLATGKKNINSSQAKHEKPNVLEHHSYTKSKIKDHASY